MIKYQVLILTLATISHAQIKSSLTAHSLPQITSKVSSSREVVCFYNVASGNRDGQAKFSIKDLDNAAMNYCTQLVYGYAVLDEDTYGMRAANPDLELPGGGNHYQLVTSFKISHGLKKVLLSVGGGFDGGFDGDHDKYFELMSSPDKIKKFVDTSYQMVKAYGFDGMDLAWQFPATKPRPNGLFSKVKSFFKSKDSDEAAHRDQFTNLVSEIHKIFQRDNLQLTLTVLPAVNSTVYYDVPRIIDNLDQVHIMAFDYITPKRYPKTADFIAPMTKMTNRTVDENVEYQASYWTNNFREHKNKIIIGVPLHGHTWKLTTSDMGHSGFPPVDADGKGEGGAHFKKEGFMSQPEICAKNGVHNELKVFNDNLGGAYAFKLPNKKENGLWIGYENPTSLMSKTAFVNSRNLGGIAFNDIGYDDFKGLCSGSMYPMLNAAKNAFNVVKIK